MKIHELTKSLNPEAEEWRPASQPPHHLPLSMFQTPPPPPKLHLQQPDYLHYFYTYLPQQQPIYSISFPAIPMSLKAAAEASAPLLHEKAEHSQSPSPSLQENSSSNDEKKMVMSPILESPKHPRPHDYVMKKGSKRALPPRLRRAFREAEQPQPPPPPEQQRWHNKSRHGGATGRSKLPALDPPLKREWKPKTKAKSDLQVSGVGGAAASLPPSRSTVMIKNIPSQLRRDFMLQFIDGYCRRYSLEYDFLYLPIDFRRLGNLGYAFVNFTTEAGALKFKQVVNNYKWRTIYREDGDTIISNKVCEIKWARIQGKEALIRRFERSNFNCKELEFLPVVLEPPRNGSDPNPPPPVNLGKISFSLSNLSLDRSD